MLKQVYKLKLPSLREIFTESFMGYKDDDLSYNYIVETNLNDIVKPEWQTFLDFNWHRLLYFKKDNNVGSIHTDSTLPGTTVVDYNSTVWGINWVIGGIGIMNFWDFNQVEEIGITPGSLNIPDDGKVNRFKPLTVPLERHMLYPDCAYLVNATLPHQALGVGPRKVFSLRPTTLSMPWDEVVNSFKQYIV